MGRNTQHDYLGLASSTTPPLDVDASALWSLWLCLRGSELTIDDFDRNSRVWPDCIRRLGQEGFVSTALCLFECWLIHQSIVIESLSAQFETEHATYLEYDALPDDDDLLALVKSLQGWTAHGRLDGILHFTAARLRRGNGRYSYLAEQLEAQASSVSAPDDFKTAVISSRIHRLESDSLLVRDRLREQMDGYNRLPSDLQNMLATAERVRDVVIGDGVFDERDPSSWAHSYGRIVERAVRDAFGRVGTRSLAQMYRGGGGSDALQVERLTLGHLPRVLEGASSRPEWQQELKSHRIDWESMGKPWRERLKWVTAKRNLASHSEPMPSDEAEQFRQWMYAGFVPWLEPLGILRPERLPTHPSSCQ